MADTEERECILDDIERFLQGMIARLTPMQEASRVGRPRVLPSLCLWAGLLVCVLRGFSSQLALWRLLTYTGLWFYPRFALSDQAVYKRLAQEGLEPLQRLFSEVSSLLASQAPLGGQPLAPFAAEVMALDEATLDQVARLLPSLRALPPGDQKLLPGKLAGLFDLRRQQWRRVQHIADAQENEKEHARALVQGLPRGSLILADLGYFGFAWFDWLTDNGYAWLSRLRAKTSYLLLHAFYQQGDIFDGIVFLGKHRADRAAHAVRLVRFRVGMRTYSYITNVLDPQVLPLAEIARLYARRWDIELAILLIKRHLKLHLLWSAKPLVVQQQLWAVLIIAQILQALRLEIATQAKVDPYDVSMALLVAYLPQFARDGTDPIQAFVEHGRAARFIRPSSRTVIEAPTIAPAEIAPLPAGTVLVREPRYAQRKCDRRGRKAN